MMASARSVTVDTDAIMRNILVIRGQRVLLDSGLAALYQVATKACPFICRVPTASREHGRPESYWSAPRAGSHQTNPTVHCARELGRAPARPLSSPKAHRLAAARRGASLQSGRGSPPAVLLVAGTIGSHRSIPIRTPQTRIVDAMSKADWLSSLKPGFVEFRSGGSSFS
jgi:hypothetical protein